MIEPCKPLIGMKACESDRRNGIMGICDYAGYSESTILKWINTMGFPARKLGNKWISTTDQVNRFFTQYIDNMKEET